MRKEHQALLAMASETAALPPRPRPVKRPLSPLKVALYRLLFPVGLVMFVAGFAGKMLNNRRASLSNLVDR